MITTTLLVGTFLFQAKEDWVDTHRVHLRNGNVIDGVLVRMEPKKARLILGLPFGEIVVRYADLARMAKGTSDPCCSGIAMNSRRVHGIRPRTKGQKAAAVKIREEAPTTTRPERNGESTGRSEHRRPPRRGEFHGPDARLVREIAEIKKEVGAARRERLERLKSHVPNAPELLAALLGRIDVESAELILLALQGSHDAGAIAALQKLGTDPGPAVRRLAVRGLALMLEPDGPEPLRPFLKDSDAQVRMYAIDALLTLSDEDALEPILERTVDADPVVRKSAGRAAVKLARTARKIDRTGETLQDLMDRAKGEVLADVISTLANLGYRPALGTVRERLRDGDAVVRASAAHAVGQLGGDKEEDDRSVDDLLALLGDEKVRWVRIQICGALDRLNRPKAVESLIQVLEADSDFQVKQAAGRALMHITGEKTFGMDGEKWRSWFEKKRAGAGR